MIGTQPPNQYDAPQVHPPCTPDFIFKNKSNFFLGTKHIPWSARRRSFNYAPVNAFGGGGWPLHCTKRISKVGWVLVVCQRWAVVYRTRSMGCANKSGHDGLLGEDRRVVNTAWVEGKGRPPGLP